MVVALKFAYNRAKRLRFGQNFHIHIEGLGAFLEARTAIATVTAVALRPALPALTLSVVCKTLAVALAPVFIALRAFVRPLRPDCSGAHPSRFTRPCRREIYRAEVQLYCLLCVHCRTL